MRNRIVNAAIVAEAYKNRTISSVKENANKMKEEMTSENMKDLAIASAVLGGIYLTARVAGFKAGYKHAKTN